jgi:hypothetical protein
VRVGLALRHEAVRECVYGAELDLQTLICTRGRDFRADDAREPAEVSEVRIAPGARGVHGAADQPAASRVIHSRRLITSQEDATSGASMIPRAGIEKCEQTPTYRSTSALPLEIISIWDGSIA